MSTQSLYRALLKSAKRYDSNGWRRSLLLNSLTKTSSVTSSIGSTEKSGRALFFLARNSDDAQYMVRDAFRQPLEGSLNEAVNRGFEVLRTLNAADASAVSTASYAPFSSSSSLTSVLPSIPIRTSTTTAAPASSTSHLAAARTQALPQVLRMPLHHSSSSSSSSSRAAGSSSLSAGGPAVRQMPRPAKDYGAHTSILGRLHSESMDLQKPRTPPPRLTPTEESPVDRNRDSGYESALFQMRIVASEYLKQLNSVSAHDPAACNGQSDATAASPASAAMSLHLIERSRMKAQHKQWESEVRKLNVQQQLQLEEAVNSLGQSVVANNLKSVLQFQSELSSTSPEIRLALLSNNQVLDAWIDFLHSNNQFGSIVQLFRTRLENDVCTDEFSLSRKSLCKVLMSCAVEGEAETSLMALRESSWSALANENPEVLKTEEFNYGDLKYPTSTPAAPTSVNRQPSWVPAGAFFQNLSAQPRTTLESEEAPDIMLAAAGEDFGSQVNNAVSTATILAPAPNPRVHLTVNVNARSINDHASYLRRFNSTFLNPPSPQSSSHASMSTCARPPSRPPTPPQLQEQPPTPVPIIDHWTELSLDSRLIEMAIVAAVRAQARKKEFDARDAEEAIKAQAAANQLHPDAEINFSIHQHAAAIARQQQEAKKQSQEWSEVIEEEKPMSVFEALNSNESPLAFQLWSLMLQQRVPLQHSNSFVQLMNNLESNTDSLSKSTANLFLQTLSHELHHARKSDSFRFKYLRGDVEKFLGMELDLNQHLAVDDNGADNVWQCLTVLRTMQQEQLTPSVAALNTLFQNMLFFSENGYGRSKLIQDLLCIVDDFSAVNPNINVDAVLNCLENPTQPQ